MLKRDILSGVIIFFLALSVFSCASSEETKKEDNTTHNDKNSTRLSPGSVNVRALILGIHKNNDSSFCDVRIKEVLGYGSSTPPLPVDSEIRLFYNPGNINDNDLNKFLAGKEISVHINYSTAYGDNAQWTLRNFINKD